MCASLALGRLKTNIMIGDDVSADRISLPVAEFLPRAFDVVAGQFLFDLDVDLASSDR